MMSDIFKGIIISFSVLALVLDLSHIIIIIIIIIISIIIIIIIIIIYLFFFSARQHKACRLKILI